MWGGVWVNLWVYCVYRGMANRHRLVTVGCVWLAWNNRRCGLRHWRHCRPCADNRHHTHGNSACAAAAPSTHPSVLRQRKPTTAGSRAWLQPRVTWCGWHVRRRWSSTFVRCSDGFTRPSSSKDRCRFASEWFWLRSQYGCQLAVITATDYRRRHSPAVVWWRLAPEHCSQVTVWWLCYCYFSSLCGRRQLIKLCNVCILHRFVAEQ